MIRRFKLRSFNRLRRFNDLHRSFVDNFVSGSAWAANFIWANVYASADVMPNADDIAHTELALQEI